MIELAEAIRTLGFFIFWGLIFGAGCISCGNAIS